MSKKFLTDIDIDNNSIKNLKSPIDQLDAVNKDFIDELFIDNFNICTFNLISNITPPPLVGEIKFNNTTILDISEIFINKTDNLSFDISTIIDKNISNITLFQISDNSKWISFNITDIIDNTSYYTLHVNILNISNNTPPDLDSLCKVIFNEGVQQLSEVLKRGNKTDGSDIVISDGDKLRSYENTSLTLKSDVSIIKESPYFIEVTQITVTTTDNVITTIYTYTPIDDDVYTIEYNVKGYENTTGDAFGAKLFATFKKYDNIVTQIGTTTIDRKSNFPALVTATITTNGTNILFNVRGRNNSTIVWKSNNKIIK